MIAGEAAAHRAGLAHPFCAAVAVVAIALGACGSVRPNQQLDADIGPRPDAGTVPAPDADTGTGACVLGSSLLGTCALQ